MFTNYFKIAWRNLWKHKLLSWINLGGLAIGIAAVLLIGIYIQSEISYDTFHGNAATIYRVGFRSAQDGKIIGESPDFTAPFSVDAKNIFPEIQSYCRISENHEAYFSYNDKSLKTSAITYADSSFFNFFSFKLIKGNAANALSNPNSVVLSQTMANKIFGGGDAVGKTIMLDGNAGYLVTGIAEDAASNSTVQYEALVSLSTLYHDTTYFMDWNGGWQYNHYLMLKKNASAQALEKKFTDFMWANYNEKYAGTSRTDAFLQPLLQLHLYFSSDSANTRTNLYVFAITALLILIISCINYVNLSVARASSRFKEIGVRKVLGALRMQLVKQFIGETFLITLCSMLLSVFLTLLLLPVYKELSGKNIIITQSEIIFGAVLIAALAVLITISAGAYLAFYLSSFNPLHTLKMQLPKSGKQSMGKALIVFQFTITAALISSVFIMQLQLQYIKNKPLGFDKEHILVLPLTGNAVQEKALLLKQQSAAMPGVASVSAMSEIPYNDITQNGFLPQGSKNYITAHQLDADEDMLATMNIKLAAGNYFSKDRPSDADGYLINQALADKLGWKDPVGKFISRDGDHKIIGVVNNFHFASMHDKIEPLIITAKPWMNHYGCIAIKYNSQNPSALVQNLQTVWKQQAGTAPFDYWFLDDAFDKLYKSEEKFRQLFFIFSVLSVVLSLAGIFGLVLLNIQNKTKEIGIRKVLGAGVADIIQLSAKNFLLLILLASGIAVPLAWYYSGAWLQNFAYRINISWWMFAAAGLVVIVFAFIIIGIQTAKAAMANPVKNLRTE